MTFNREPSLDKRDCLLMIGLCRLHSHPRPEECWATFKSFHSAEVGERLTDGTANKTAYITDRRKQCLKNFSFFLKYPRIVFE